MSLDREIQRAMTVNRNMNFQFCFQFLKVERKGFHIVELNFHGTRMLKRYGTFYFRFWRAIVNFYIANQNFDVCNFLLFHLVI